MDENVDFELGNNASEIMASTIRETKHNLCRYGLELIEMGSGFSSVKCLSGSGLDGKLTQTSSDGIGTAVELAERTKRFDTIAFNLMAMLADDGIRYGFVPIYFTSVLDVNTLKIPEALPAITQLAKGLIEAANIAEVAVVNGETAELGQRVGGYGNFHFNWGGSLTSVLTGEKYIDGSEIHYGDTLIGFGEDTFRSNGFTLVRRVMEDGWGESWHTRHILDGRKIGDIALGKPKIYTPIIKELLRQRASISGMAHITGGGLPEKLGRMLKSTGLGADIADPMEPCEFLKISQDIGLASSNQQIAKECSDFNSYKNWNMGQGFVVAISDRSDVSQIYREAHSRGYRACVIGEVTKKPGIRITSKGKENPGQILQY